MPVLIPTKISRSALRITFASALLSTAFAADTTLVPMPETSVAALSRAALLSAGERPHTYTLRTPEQQAAYNAWKISLLAVASSQALDVVSSYGMREVNPLLADATGRFGMKATGIKLGTTAGILAAQYWMVNRRPNRARRMALLNFTGAALTSAFAAHNFSIR